MSTLHITAHVKAEPQGSKHGFVVPGKNGKKARVVVVDSNKKVMRSYRDTLRIEAMLEMQRLKLVQPMAGPQRPVAVAIDFTFAKPKSVKRSHPSVAPDCDKLCRGTLDALIGVAFADDAQVVSLRANKLYGPTDKVDVWVTEL